MSSSLSGLGASLIPRPSVDFGPAQPLDASVVPLSEKQIWDLNHDLTDWANSQKGPHGIAALRAQGTITLAVTQNAAIKAIEIVFPGEPHALIALLAAQPYGITATVVASEADRAPPKYEGAPDELPNYPFEFQSPQELAARPGYEAEMARRDSLEGARPEQPFLAAEAPQEMEQNAILDALAPPLDPGAHFGTLQRKVFSVNSPQYVAGLSDEMRRASRWLSDRTVSDMVKLRELSVLVSNLASHGPSQHAHVDSAIASVFHSLKTQVASLINPGQAPWVSEMTPTIEAWFQGFQSRVAARQEQDVEGQPLPPANAAPSAPWLASSDNADAAAQRTRLDASIAALQGRFAAAHSPLDVKPLRNELEQVWSGLSSSPAVPDDWKLARLTTLVEVLRRHVHPLHADLPSATVVANFFNDVEDFIRKKPGLDPLAAVNSSMKAYHAEVKSRHVAMKQRDVAKQERDQKAAMEAQPDANGVTPVHRAEYVKLLAEVDACGTLFHEGKIRKSDNHIRIRKLIDKITNWDCPHLQLSALEELSLQLIRTPRENPNESAREANRLWPTLLIVAQNVRHLPSPENDFLRKSVVRRFTARHCYV